MTPKKGKKSEFSESIFFFNVPNEAQPESFQGTDTTFPLETSQRFEDDADDSFVDSHTQASTTIVQAIADVGRLMACQHAQQEWGVE